jgi:hypothetical protein
LFFSKISMNDFIMTIRSNFPSVLMKTVSQDQFIQGYDER